MLRQFCLADSGDFVFRMNMFRRDGITSGYDVQI